MNLSTDDTIYAVVLEIPKGRVATYGQIADLAGLSGKARSAGYALHHLTLSSGVPWHRVVNARGEISYSASRGGADDHQRTLLEQEGIVFDDHGKIDLQEFLWDS